jgi:hypothetical protein
MICSLKLALTEDLCVVQKKGKENQYAIYVKCTFDERSSIFIRDKPVFSSERRLHMDQYLQLKKKNLLVGLKGPVAKTN